MAVASPAGSWLTDVRSIVANLDEILRAAGRLRDVFVPVLDEVLYGKAHPQVVRGEHTGHPSGYRHGRSQRSGIVRAPASTPCPEIR